MNKLLKINLFTTSKGCKLKTKIYKIEIYKIEGLIKNFVSRQVNNRVHVTVWHQIYDRVGHQNYVQNWQRIIKLTQDQIRL